MCNRAEQSSTHSIHVRIYFLKLGDVYKAGRFDLALGFVPGSLGFPLAFCLFTSSTITELWVSGIRVLQASVITNWANRHNWPPQSLDILSTYSTISHGDMPSFHYPQIKPTLAKKVSACHSNNL